MKVEEFECVVIRDGDYIWSRYKKEGIIEYEKVNEIEYGKVGWIDRSSSKLPW